MVKNIFRISVVLSFFLSWAFLAPLLVQSNRQTLYLQLFVTGISYQRSISVVPRLNDLNVKTTMGPKAQFVCCYCWYNTGHHWYKVELHTSFVTTMYRASDIDDQTIRVTMPRNDLNMDAPWQTGAVLSIRRNAVPHPGNIYSGSGQWWRQVFDVFLSRVFQLFNSTAIRGVDKTCN